MPAQNTAALYSLAQSCKRGEEICPKVRRNIHPDRIPEILKGVEVWCWELSIKNLPPLVFSKMITLKKTKPNLRKTRSCWPPTSRMCHWRQEADEVTAKHSWRKEQASEPDFQTGNNQLLNIHSRSWRGCVDPFGHEASWLVSSSSSSSSNVTGIRPQQTRGYIVAEI